MQIDPVVAAYTDLKMRNVQQTASAMMLKKIMDTGGDAALDLVQSIDQSARGALELSINPGVGGQFDASV